MAEHIAFFGLGRMGLPMALNLLKAGFDVTAWNRTPDNAKPLVKQGGKLARSPVEAVKRGGIALSMVADDAALEAIATEEWMKALGPGGLHISMSTVLPTTNQRLAERHEKHGVALLAAPVFGRPEAAAAGKLWVCASGPAEAKARGKVVFDGLSQGVFDFGEAIGAANVVKLSGNFLILAAVEALAEASALVEKNGIPRAAFMNMFTQTLFACPIYQNYSKQLIEANFGKVGFALRLAFKDMNLASQTATASSVPMPTLSLLRDRYLASIAKGRGEMDATAFALEAAESAGLKW